MCGAGVIALSHRFQLNYQFDIARQILRQKTRMTAAAIRLRNVLNGFDLTRQQPAAERRIGDVANTQLLARRQNVFLGFAEPQRVFGLQRGERMFRIRAAQRFRRRLANTDEAHLAARNQFAHRAHGFFNRHMRINTMQKVDVDHIEPHALQTLVTALMHILWPAVGGFFAVGQIDVAKLGGDHHVIAAALQRTRQQRFVTRLPVSIGAVEKIDAQIKCAMNGGIEIFFQRRAKLHRCRAAPHADS